MDVDSDHWLSGTTRRPTSNCNDRPGDCEISLVVVHNISLPAGRFGTGMVEDFFCNELDCSRDPSLADLDGVRVSAHLFISRRGKVTQFVPFDRRAWHAGVSTHAGRQGCNEFSVGIELEGTDTRGYTNTQYRVLGVVVGALFRKYPGLCLGSIVGHNEIAPFRKTDPGAAFDWPRFYRSVLA